MENIFLENNGANVTSSHHNDYWYDDIFSRLTNGSRITNPSDGKNQESRESAARGKLGFLFLGVFRLPYRYIKQKCTRLPNEECTEATLALLQVGLKVLEDLPKKNGATKPYERINVCYQELLEHFTAEGHPLSDHKGSAFNNYIIKTVTYKPNWNYLEFYSNISTRPDKEDILENIAQFYTRLLEYLWPHENSKEAKHWDTIFQSVLAEEYQPSSDENKNGYYLIQSFLNAALNWTDPPNTSQKRNKEYDVSKIQETILCHLSSYNNGPPVMLPKLVFLEIFDMVCCDGKAETVQLIKKWIPACPPKIKEDVKNIVRKRFKEEIKQFQTSCLSKESDSSEESSSSPKLDFERYNAVLLLFDSLDSI